MSKLTEKFVIFADFKILVFFENFNKNKQNVFEKYALSKNWSVFKIIPKLNQIFDHFCKFAKVKVARTSNYQKIFAKLETMHF